MSFRNLFLAWYHRANLGWKVPLVGISAYISLLGDSLLLSISAVTHSPCKLHRVRWHCWFWAWPGTNLCRRYFIGGWLVGGESWWGTRYLINLYPQSGGERPMTLWWLNVPPGWKVPSRQKTRCVYQHPTSLKKSYHHQRNNSVSKWTNLSRLFWSVPIVSATMEAKMGGLFELKNWRSAWTPQPDPISKRKQTNKWTNNNNNPLTFICKTKQLPNGKEVLSPGSRDTPEGPIRARWGPSSALFSVRANIMSPHETCHSEEDSVPLIFPVQFGGSPPVFIEELAETENGESCLFMGGNGMCICLWDECTTRRQKFKMWIKEKNFEGWRISWVGKCTFCASIGT